MKKYKYSQYVEPYLQKNELVSNKYTLDKRHLDIHFYGLTYEPTELNYHSLKPTSIHISDPTFTPTFTPILPEIQTDTTNNIDIIIIISSTFGFFLVVILFMYYKYFRLNFGKKYYYEKNAITLQDLEEIQLDNNSVSFNDSDSDSDSDFQFDDIYRQTDNYNV